jgi:gliding motility-associated-like protein
MIAGDYTYTVNGTSPCPAASTMVSVSVVAAPDAGTPGSATLCSSDAPIDLFAQLGGTPDAGGAWSGPSAVSNGQFDPAVMNAGMYTYTITVPPPCVDASSTVTINVVAPPDAGSDGSLTLCISSPAAALLTSLNGTPDAGGTWSGPSPVSGGLFDPATMIAGDYTYTVNGTSPCLAASTMVSVSVVAAPDAGNDDVLILCATGDPVDLFPELGGADPGGTWTGPDGAFSGPFIPGSSSAGDYTYTVAGIPPCPAALAVITVNVVSDAYAGQDGLITLCSSANSVELFNSLGASPQVGGEWLSPSGAGFGGTFTPGIDAVGTYLYVISVPLPCVNDTAMVDVSVVQAAVAGTDSSITFCTSEGPISLMDLLGGTPDEAGYWSGPNGPTGIAFHPGYDPAGLYSYTVPGTMPCPDISSHVTIALNVPPNAGTDGSISLCPDAGTADLFASLGGNPNPGGTWATPGGLPHTGQYDPATDPQGSYTYTVTGLVPCPNDASQSTVTVYVVPAPDAGPDSVSCTLNGMLNATGTWSTGQWSGPAGSIIAAPDSVTTEVSVHAGGAYTFTWSTISAEGCASADSVTIIFTDIITPSVDVDSALCHGSCDGNFTANISGGNVGGISDYVIQVSNGGGIMPINLGYCAGNYVLTVLDTNGCSASVPFTIPEPEPLVIDLVTATDALCPNSCDGSILVGDPEGMHFSIGNGAQQTSNLFSGLCPGAYTVTMWNANGCSASGSAVVESPPPVTANFSVHPDSVFVNDPTVTFTNASSANAASFLWHFGDGSTSMETSPVHSYPMGMAAEYAVCLTAFSINGCPDSLCVPLPVLDLPAIFVPNAFTPDGDGRNDLFQVLGTGLSPEGFHLMVFDRWGELIFDTTDLGASWDGKRNGTAVKSDVYVWTVKAYSRFSIEPYEMKGHVTLLR